MRGGARAWLAAAVAVWFLVPARAGGQSHDVSLRYEGVLFDQVAKKATVTFEVNLPGSEWRDSAGSWHLELGIGAGRVRAGDREVVVRARYHRYLHDTAPRTLEDGSRVWPMRGDMYLMPAEGEVVELEVGGEATFPPAGERREIPGVPLPPDGDAGRQYAVAQMDAAQLAWVGGGIIYGRNIPVFGLPLPDLPYLGYLRLRESSTAVAKRSALERDADLLVARVQYVAADYPRSVKDGLVINEAEYSEQVTMLQEAELMVERLAIGAEGKAAIEGLRRMVSYHADPAEVATEARHVVGKLRRALWVHLSAPAVDPGFDGAGGWTTACGRCHGDDGWARTPTAATLVPAPVALADAGSIGHLSPYLAYNAVSWGIPGTGMASFADTLTPGKRWALAFHVYSFTHEATPAGQEALVRAGVATPILEDLAVQSEDDLRAWLSERLPAADVAPAHGWLRTEGTARAARSPLLGVRHVVRQTARLRLAAGQPADVVRAEARAAFDALARAETAPTPPARRDGGAWWWVLVAVMAAGVAVYAAGRPRG